MDQPHCQIDDTCAHNEQVFSTFVTTQQSPISQFNSLCNEFVSMFVYNSKY